MKELAAADLPYLREMWPREEAKAFFASRGEPLKVQLIEEKTAGQSEVSCYLIKDRDTFVDFCVGPHVPSSGKLKAFKLLTTSNAYWKGDAKNAPMQRDLRHGVPLGQGARRAPEADRGRQGARPPQGGPGDRPLHVPPVGARRRVLARQGDDALQHARRLHARGAVPRRLRRGEDAAHLQQGALGDVGPLAALPPEHVPRRVRARADGREGDELPRPHARLRQRRSAATATCRSGCTSRRRCIATKRQACSRA